MKMPSPLRIGWWHYTPEIPWQPFQHLGFYTGKLEDTILGSSFETPLEEGTIYFNANVLFRPDLYAVRKRLQGLLRNQLEIVLCLEPRSDRAALKAMWDYDLFTKEMPDEYRSLGVFPEAGDAATEPF